MLKHCRTIGLLVLSVAWLAAADRFVHAGETAGLLEGVRWAGPPVSLDGLAGKTVVLIDYATWCPKCNKWSPEFCKQLKTAIEGRPIVVLAVDNDDSPAPVRKYVTEHGFLGPNIIHGYDPTIAKRTGLPDLWGYMIIDPSGKVTKKSQCGMHYGDDNHMQFVLPKELTEAKNPGKFIVMDAKMDDTVKEALWPLELGLSTGGLSAATRKKLSAEQRQQIEIAMNKYLDSQLADIQKQAKGDLNDRFDAYELAVSLSTRFKTSEQGKEARKLALSLDEDAAFKREMAAKRAYDKLMASTLTPPRKASSMKMLAKRFDGTQYGEKAKVAAEGKGE